MNSIAITTECTADLPRKLLEQYKIDIIYMDIETDSGIFRDTTEIDSGNITEYMAGGKRKAQSIVPSATDYGSFFRSHLEDYDEIIHICIGSSVSAAMGNARVGREKLGNESLKVHLIDSGHLSTGVGLLVLEAARLRDEGLGSKDIVKKVTAGIPYICTSFLAYNADYLYYNNKVSEKVMKICRLFRLHPVLAVKEGRLVLKRLYFGNYEKAAEKYIASTLKDNKRIHKGRAFITYVGCGHELLESVNEKISRYVKFDEVWEKAASATIAANCGPLTFGILFQKNGGTAAVDRKNDML